MKKVLLTTVMFLVMCLGVCAQTSFEWMYSPKSTEIVIGVVSLSLEAGSYTKWNTGGWKDKRITYTDEQLYNKLLSEARTKYGNTYPQLKLRNFKSAKKETDHPNYVGVIREYECSATVVASDSQDILSQAIDKALRNVYKGSRIAIDQITVSYGFNREELNDKMIDALLDKGYRVVAKEYLQRLYQEQQDQLNSGLYNPDTTVEGSKFSAVGYFINVKVTETSIRVQVVNVSTGEYEGNATVNF